MSVKTNCATCAATLPIVRFASITDTRPVAENGTWADLRNLLGRQTELRVKGGPLWSPATYAKDATKGTEGVVGVTAFVGDIDDGTSPERVRETLDGLGLEYLIHSTHGSTPSKPKYRVAVPLAAPVPKAEWPGRWAQLNELVTGGHSDPATKDAARAFYLPSHPPGVEPFEFTAHGRSVDTSSLLALPPTAARPSTPAAPDFAFVSSIESLLQRVQGFSPEGPIFRRLLETTRGEPREHSTNLLLAWVLFKCGATVSQISRLVDWPETNVSSTVARFRRQGAYSFSFDKLARADPLVREARDALQIAEPDGSPANPWAGREGWSDEPLLPILFQTVEGDDNEEDEDPSDSDARKPVEPGYVLYNRLIESDHFRPFRTHGMDARVAVPSEHGLEIHNPAAPEFVERVGYSLFTLKGRKIPLRALKSAASALTSRALSRSLPRARVLDLWLRWAPAGRFASRIDMVDEARRCLYVSADGWRVEEVGHPTFDLRSHMLPLPVPTRGAGPDGDWSRVNRLWRYIPIPEGDGARDQRLLVLADLVQSIVAPRSPKLVKVLVAEQGAGKSTQMEFYQAVLDPSTVPHMKPPEARNDDAAMNIAVNHATVNLDNISSIPLELSDFICRITSGTGLVKRKLYSDSEETVVTVWRSVMLNGITATPRMADLLRRVLFLEPSRPKTQIAKEELGKLWELDHPEILGGVLDLAVLTARVLRDGQIPVETSDMADYVRVGRALAVAIGLTAQHFQYAWDSNVDLQTNAAAQDVYAIALFDFFSTFTPATPAVSAEKIAGWILANRPASFPKGTSAQLVGNAIARVKKTLERMGLYIGKRYAHGGVAEYFRLDGPGDGSGGSENVGGGFSGPRGPPVHQTGYQSQLGLQGSREAPVVAPQNPGGPPLSGVHQGAPTTGGPPSGGSPGSTRGPPAGSSSENVSSGGPVDLLSSKSGTERERAPPAEEGLDVRARIEARKAAAARRLAPDGAEWASPACIGCGACKAPHANPEACSCGPCSPWGHSNTAVGDRQHYCGPIEPRAAS